MAILVAFGNAAKGPQQVGHHSSYRLWIRNINGNVFWCVFLLFVKFLFWVKRSEVKWSEGEGEVKRRGIPSQCSGFSFTVTLQKCSKTPKTASPVVHRWEALVNFPCDFKSSRERLWIETIPWLLGQLWSNHSGQFIWIFVWNVPPRV